MLWNRSAQRMFGYSENEILGKPISILFPDEYHESYQKVMDNPYNSANSQNMGVIYESYGFKKDIKQVHAGNFTYFMEDKE